MNDLVQRLRASVDADANELLDRLLDEAADRIEALEQMMHAMVKDHSAVAAESDQHAEWTRQLDLSRSRRIQELVDQIEGLQAKLAQQEHYYQMNVARIGELEAVLRKILDDKILLYQIKETAQRALAGES